MKIDYERFICKRAVVDDVVFEDNRWYAIVCSWFGQERACIRIDVTSIIEPLVRREAERVLEERCAGDEECIEYYWDLALEEAVERIAESELPMIAVKDHLDTIVEQACPDLLDALAPRMTEYSKFIEAVYESIMEFEPLWSTLWHRLVGNDPTVHVLTSVNFDEREAENITSAMDVEGKTVVEVGAGTGFFATFLARRGARLVVAVERNPLWALAYLRYIYPRVLAQKLPVVYVVGDAEALARLGRVFDLGVVVTVSGADYLCGIALQMARKAILAKPVSKQRLITYKIYDCIPGGGELGGK